MYERFYSLREKPFALTLTIIAADLVEQVIADRASGGLLPLRVVGKRVNDALAAV